MNSSLNRLKYIYFLIIILLFISLANVVLAVQTVKITGDAGLEGIRGTNDITQVNTLSDENLSIVRGENDYPMSCEQNQDNTFSCEHTFEEASLEAGEYVLKFKGLETSQVFTWPFIVDGLAPIVDDFTIEPQGEFLNLTIAISEFAFSSSDKCSGIKSIEITTEETGVYTQAIDDSSVCFYKKSMLIKPPAVSGELTFTATVSDYLGQFSQLDFGPLFVDFEKPEIQDNVIILSGENIIDTIAARPVIVPVAEVHVKIKDENLTLVTGDLHLLSRDPLLKEKDSSRTASCTKEGLLYDCVFESVTINPGATSVELKIIATDNKGHVSTKNVTAKFTIQNQLSEITFFGKQKESCFQDNCYYRSGSNKIWMHITTQDVEIKPYLITISTSGLANLDKVKLSNCNDTGEYYECYGYLPVDSTIISGSSHKIVLTNPSTDYLGSQLTGITSTMAIIDQDAPKNISELDFSVECPIAGEKAEVTINVTDDVSPIVRIKAMPKVITTTNLFENDCERQGNIFVCKLELNTFVSHAENENVQVIIEDLAGNQLELTKQIQVCEAETQVPPESIAKITSDPKQKIDKRMMTFMPINAYLPLDFDFKNPNTKIIGLDTTGCSATKELAGKPYFIKKQFTNQQDFQPVLVVPIGGRKQLIDSEITINCTIKIYEQRDVLRFIKPEEETIVVKLPTFNQELGTITNSTNKKLKEIASEISDLQKNIDNWNKYIGIVDKLCTLSSTFNKLFSTVSAIQSALYPIFIATSWIGGFSESIWEKLCKVFKKVNELRSKLFPIGKLTKGLNLDSDSEDKLNIGLKSFLKIGCLTYNCGLCSPEGVYQAINIVGTAMAEMDALKDQKDLDLSGSRRKALQSELDDVKNKLKTLKDNQDFINKNEASTSLSDEDKQQLVLAKQYVKDNEKNEQKWIDKRDSLSKEYKDVVQTAESKEDDLKNKLIENYDNLHPDNAFGEPNLDQLKQEQVKLKENIKSIKSTLQIVKTQSDSELKEYLKSLKSFSKQLLVVESKLEVFDKLENYNYQKEEQSAFAKREANIYANGQVERLDPFEDVKFASGCLCAPGVLYAKEKLKQLNCRMYKCIEENAKTGLPITACEIDFDQGKCMYYDGPLSNEGFWKSFMNKLWRGYFYGDADADSEASAWAIANKAILAGRKILCPEEYLPSGVGTKVANKVFGDVLDISCTLAGGWRTVTCSLTGSYLTISNYKSYFQNPWQPGIRKLEGEDYCQGIPLEQTEN